MIEYTVVNASIGTAQREAEIDGETVTITSQRAEIEAVPADPRNGTLIAARISTRKARIAQWL